MVFTSPPFSLTEISLGPSKTVLRSFPKPSSCSHLSLPLSVLLQHPAPRGWAGWLSFVLQGTTLSGFLPAPLPSAFLNFYQCLYVKISLIWKQYITLCKFLWLLFSRPSVQSNFGEVLSPFAIFAFSTPMYLSVYTLHFHLWHFTEACPLFFTHAASSSGTWSRSVLRPPSPPPPSATAWKSTFGFQIIVVNLTGRQTIIGLSGFGSSSTPTPIRHARDKVMATVTLLGSRKGGFCFVWRWWAEQTFEIKSPIEDLCLPLG